MARLLPFALFFAVACTILFGGHYYLWARLVRDPGFTGPAARVLTAAIAGLGVGLPLAMIGARLFQSEGSRPLLFLAFSWMGIGFILTSLLLLGDLGRVALHSWFWLTGARGAGEGLSDPSRRLLFSRTLAALVGVSGVGLSALGLREALGQLRVKELEVKLKNLPAALAGLRLVQISDVHIGALLRKEWLQGVIDQIGALKPDLVVITGDLVDGSVEQLREQVAPLAQLQAHAPRGVFFSTGNHDYYSGADEWSAHLPTLGVRPLRNQRIEVAPGLDLAGIDDLTDPASKSGRNLTRALAGRDPERPIVLLAHQPKQFAQAASLGVDLTLSGHTHGGQIFPFNWVVRLQQPFVAGLHQLGGSQLYVSRGTGFWGPPLRLAAPAEITLLKLQPA